MATATQPTSTYRELQVMTATPLQRLLMAYDAAIMGCNQRDLKRTTDALNLLRNSLDMEQGEVPMGFLRLYLYCADLVRAGRYDEAAAILRELVQTWVRVLVSETDIQMPTVRPDRDGLSLVG